MKTTEKLPVRTAIELKASAPKGSTDLILGTLTNKDGDKLARITRRVALGWISKGADKPLAIKDAAAKFPETAFLTERIMAYGENLTLHGGSRANGWWTVQMLAVDLVLLYARYEDATGTRAEPAEPEKNPSPVADNSFKSIFATSADSPEQLRACDLDRVLESAHDQKRLHEFAAWLLTQNLTPQTRAELVTRAPHGADAHICFTRENGIELQVLPGGVALKMQSIVKPSPTPVPIPVAVPVSLPAPSFVPTSESPAFHPMTELSVNRKQAFMGNCAAPESPYITDGRILFVKSACDAKFARLKPADVGRYGPASPAPDKELKRIFDSAVANATVDAQIMGYGGEDNVPLACIATHNGNVVIVDAHKLKFIQQKTGADAVRVSAIEPEKYPIVLFKAGQPVAVVITCSAPNAAAQFKSMVSAASHPAELVSA